MVNKKKLNKILTVVSLAALMSSVTVTTTQNYASADYSSAITSKITSIASNSETKTTGTVTKVDNNKVTVKLSDTTYGKNQGSTSQEQSSSNPQGGAPQGQPTRSEKSKDTTTSQRLLNTSAVKDTTESTSSTADSISTTSSESGTAATKKILPNTVAVKDTTESTSSTADSKSASTTDSTSTKTTTDKASTTTDSTSKKSTSTTEKASTKIATDKASTTTDSTSKKSTSTTEKTSTKATTDKANTATTISSTTKASTSTASTTVNGTISFDGTNVSSTASGVTIEGRTLSITKSGTYVLKGNGTTYAVVVDASVTDPVTINLDSLKLTDSSITSKSLADLNVNVVSDSSIASSSGNAIEATGVLSISSSTEATLDLSSSSKHAVKADSVDVSNVKLNLTSDSKDGINATTSATIDNSTVAITAGDDGIQVEDETDVNSGDLTINNSKVTINSTDKGITASDELNISGTSTVNITAGDEGLEGRYVNLTGGDVTIKAGDDGINATEWTQKENADTSKLTNSTSELEHQVAIVVDGSNVNIVADGDGIDSNGNVSVKSGSLYVTQTSVDNAAIDYDGTGTITGGTVWAIGNQGMAQAFTTGSSQSYIIANINGSAGDTITVKDSSGNVLGTTTAAVSFGNVVFSVEALESNQTYTVTTSSGATATATATTETSTTGFNPGQMGGPGGVQGGPGGQKGTPPQMPNGQAPQGQSGISGQTTGTTTQNTNAPAGRGQGTPPQMPNGQAPQGQSGTSSQTTGTTTQNTNVPAGGGQGTPPQMPNGQAPQGQSGTSGQITGTITQNTNAPAGGGQGTPPQMPNGQVPQGQPGTGEQQAQGRTGSIQNSNWKGKTLPKTSVQSEETYDLEGVKIVKETSNGEESASLSDIKENDVIEVYKDSSGNITKVVIKNKDASKATTTSTGQQGTLSSKPDSNGNSSQSGATTGQQVTPPNKPGSNGSSNQLGATTGQQVTPPSQPGGSGGFGGGSQQVTQGSAATNITEEKTVDGETYTSTGDDENALRVTGVKATLKNITVNKESGSSSNVESGDFYGMNAGFLATDGAEVSISGAAVKTNAQNGNGVFSYGNGTVVNIENSTIKTTKDNSGGIQTTGGATTNAKNLTVNTIGNSSAAIRSDRGGGTVNVDGGNYTSTGYNSPAVYSTANITVKNSNLTAENSEALVIEGQNSITIENSTVSGNMSDTNGSSSDNNVHNIMIYQSMSGDAEVGKSTFSMKDGKIINNNGDVIYVTNTTSEIYLSNTEIDNKETNGYLLNISGNDASRGWGTAGSNGGDVTFTADNQKLEGKIVVDTISKLNLTLKNKSVFTGTINITENEQNGTAVSDNAVVTVEEGSTWNLTGDSKITSLTNKGTINFNGYTITLADGTVLKG